MKFNTNSIKTRNIFEPGFLTQLTDDVISGKPSAEIRKLTTDEMQRLPEIYAPLNYKPDMLKELSVNDFIDGNSVYKTPNGKDITGEDIKAITMLMYLKPRTAYWKPDKPQIYDSSCCGAVPLPMLGFKRFRNINYEDWFIADQDISVVFNLDLLLGATLSSTKYDDSAGEVCWNKSLGLYRLSDNRGGGTRPNANDVKRFRTKGMGNHAGSYASVYGTSQVPEEGANLSDKLYNRCTTPMRLMLAQRWAWYGKHRNSDMICDFEDWDNIPKDIETVFDKLEPQVGIPDGLKRAFGIGI